MNLPLHLYYLLGSCHVDEDMMTCPPTIHAATMQLLQTYLLQPHSR